LRDQRGLHLGVEHYANGVSVGARWFDRGFGFLCSRWSWRRGCGLGGGRWCSARG
jgi:hypothetical protein